MSIEKGRIDLSKFNISFPDIQEGDPQIRGIVTFQISTGNLPLYQQAGEQTGYAVEVTAREGQEHTFWYESRLGQGEKESSGWRSVTIPAGYVAIQIQRPEGQREHQPFWDELTRLKEAMQAQPK